jgi:hypothetical protein
MEPVKTCKKCGEPKPTAEFYRESRGAHSKSRFRSACKDCWLGKEPPVTDDERKEFVKNFIVDHLTQRGETVDVFFRHWLSFKYSEITQEAVERAIRDLLKEANVKITRRETAGKYGYIEFLALAQGKA